METMGDSEEMAWQPSIGFYWLPNTQYDEGWHSFSLFCTSRPRPHWTLACEELQAGKVKIRILYFHGHDGVLGVWMFIMQY